MSGGNDGRGAVRGFSAATGARARAAAAWFHRTPIAPPIEALSFWLAVLLPIVYLPLLLLEFPTRYGFPVFIALLVLHFVVISLGHAYRE